MAEEDISTRWQKLCLTEEESDDVVIDKEWTLDNAEVGKTCLIGKVVSKKPVDIEGMKNVFVKTWQVSNIKEVGERVYVFQLSSEKEKHRVLGRQPWCFNKALIVLREFDGLRKPEEIEMSWCPFWVQIHGLPLGFMTEKIGIVLGEKIGEVESVDASEDGPAFGKWLRVRVSINIEKPLKRGSTVTTPEGKRMWVSFKYEKLQDFCYTCGRVDHIEQDCSVRDIREYGPWLRADGVKEIEDPAPPSSAAAPVFGQPSQTSPVVFDGQQNEWSPFQASGSLEFSGGGSFSLGSVGGDKSGRKTVRINRRRNQKKW